MKRILASILSIILPLLAQAQFKTGYSELNESDICASMRENVMFLSSAALEGRKAGSEGEREAAAYLTQKLMEAGVDVISGADGEVFGLKQESGDTLRSRNVIGYIPGYDKNLKDHYIVIGARMDNLGSYMLNQDGKAIQKIYYGANANASGMAMLIELARMLSTNSLILKRSVLICGFGASESSNAGSWYFLNRSFKDVANIDAMINLETLGTASNGFFAYTASNVDLNDMLKTVCDKLQPITPQTVSKEPCQSDHRAFYDRRIPAVMFTTGMFPEYRTDKDTADILEYTGMERELEFLYNFSVTLVNGAKPLFRLSDETRRKVPGMSSDGTVAYGDCDYKPSFLGSQDPAMFLKKWVYVYLRYPQEAVREGIQGRVLVDFVINEKGKVQDVKVRKGVDPLLDAEAIRVISASPDWKPGRLRGQKVKTSVSMYVEFKLERKK